MSSPRTLVGGSRPGGASSAPWGLGAAGIGAAVASKILPGSKTVGDGAKGAPASGLSDAERADAGASLRAAKNAVPPVQPSPLDEVPNFLESTLSGRQWKRLPENYRQALVTSGEKDVAALRHLAKRQGDWLAEGVKLHRGIPVDLKEFDKWSNEAEGGFFKKLDAVMTEAKASGEFKEHELHSFDRFADGKNLYNNLRDHPITKKIEKLKADREHAYTQRKQVFDRALDSLAPEDADAWRRVEDLTDDDSLPYMPAMNRLGYERAMETKFGYDPLSPVGIWDEGNAIPPAKRLERMLERTPERLGTSIVGYRNYTDSLAHILRLEGASDKNIHELSSELKKLIAAKGDRDATEEWQEGNSDPFRKIP